MNYKTTTRGKQQADDKACLPVSRISVSLPPQLLEELDHMVEGRGYGSRSQAIGDMVNYQLAEHKRGLVG